MDLIEHKLLTLDYWKNSVTYMGQTVPTGTLGCAALNIPDEVIERLNILCSPLSEYLGLWDNGHPQRTHMLAARESALVIVKLLRNMPPFVLLDASDIENKVSENFSEDSHQNAAEYIKFLNDISKKSYQDKTECNNVIDPNESTSAFNDKYKKALSLLRILPVLAHLGFSLGEFKKTMSAFAEKLQEGDRTPFGYAVSFDRFLVKNLW